MPRKQKTLGQKYRHLHSMVTDFNTRFSSVLKPKNRKLLLLISVRGYSLVMVAEPEGELIGYISCMQGYKKTYENICTIAKAYQVMFNL